MSNSYLVTGAQGCIGAWVVKLLVERGDRPLVLDLSDDNGRLAQIASAEILSRVEYRCGDITDFDTVHGVLEESGAQRIIHLAGLQVPFCKADPPLGAAVNVLGTVNIFEAARRQGVERVAYASSAAVYGPDAPDRADEAADCHPTTHYGVYKCANEGNARIYFQDEGLTSVGLRPLTVYGVA
ncbi:MAG: NAD-dependent epimerase/dehydratase, partial [Planctomycetota bacterium]|nr:NAD-dependent epimerase/dehydratase [Planctomycetota bacterium]